MIRIFCLISFLLAGLSVTAQEKRPKSGQTLSIGSGGVKIRDKGDTTERLFEVQFGVMDLGVNTLHDKTNYRKALAQEFLNVDQALRNENLFSLRTGKSVNVNIYPLMLKWRALKTEGQKLFLSTGVGLQMYNFRFTKNISYVNHTVPQVIMDTVSFSKNKLAFTYLSVPLMVTSKTRLAPKTWLVYGAGITGGYRLGSWTKQVSGERGKQKNHDAFNFRDFNSCVTAEIGLDDYFRLYASYQLTSLAENALDQHPFCIGLRLLGI